MTQTPILYFKRGRGHIGNEKKIQHNIQDHNQKYHLAHLAHGLRNFNTLIFIHYRLSGELQHQSFKSNISYC